MYYLATTVSLGSRFCARADAAEDRRLGLDPISIFTLLANMLPSILQAFAACKKQPPSPGPVPTALAAVGVTQDTWEQANAAKYGAQEAAVGSGFSTWAINRAAKEIMKSQHKKKKDAKPMAIAALETARDESIEEMCVSLQQVKSNNGIR